MKALLFFISMTITTVCSVCMAQGDTARQIEPGQKTSFDNYQLLLIAIIGLALLIGIRIWFRRKRKI